MALIDIRHFLRWVEIPRCHVCNRELNSIVETSVTRVYTTRESYYNESNFLKWDDVDSDVDTDQEDIICGNCNAELNEENLNWYLNSQ